MQRPEDLWDMQNAVEITTRQAWTQILARFRPEPSPEHRRREIRYDTGLASVALAYESAGQKFVRKGKVLNVSPNGMLLRLQDQIDAHTTVLLKLTLTEGQALLVGRVVHSTPTVGAHKVGIKLTFDNEKTPAAASRRRLQQRGY
jgi:hypothetical protein